MIGYIALILLLAFCYSYFKDIFINEDSKFFDNNYTKLTAPKPSTFTSAAPKITFKTIYKQALSFIQYIKSLNIFKKMYQLSNIMLISVAIHIVALLILGAIKLKEKPIENNWQVQLAPTEQEIKEIQVAEMTPPPEEGDSSMEGGNENKTDDYAKDIPVPEISDDVLVSASISQPSFIKPSLKTHMAKVNLNNFVKGNSAGTGKGYGFGNGNGFGGNGNGNGNGSTIFGEKIIAKKLGVILDISPSMSLYIPRLKSEIEENFKNAKFIEVNGCAVRQSSPTTYAVEDLASKGVDAIYWFCDLQDNRTNDGMEKIKQILRSKGIRLYVKSLDFAPDEQLQSIIISSGGTFLTGQFKTFSKL